MSFCLFCLLLRPRRNLKRKRILFLSRFFFSASSLYSTGSTARARTNGSVAAHIPDWLNRTRTHTHTHTHSACSPASTTSLLLIVLTLPIHAFTTPLSAHLLSCLACHPLAHSSHTAYHKHLPPSLLVQPFSQITHFRSPKPAHQSPHMFLFL